MDNQGGRREADLTRRVARTRGEAMLGLLAGETDMASFGRVVRLAFGVGAAELVEYHRRRGGYPSLHRPGPDHELYGLWREMLSRPDLAALEREDPLVFCLELSRRLRAQGSAAGAGSGAASPASPADRGGAMK